MSADLLRRAAALMRERAEAAENAASRNWYAEDGFADGFDIFALDPESPTFPFDVAKDLHDKGLADHVASWDPAAALTVAGTLDEVADHYDIWENYAGPFLAIATAYLGEPS